VADVCDGAGKDLEPVQQVDHADLVFDGVVQQEVFVNQENPRKRADLVTTVYNYRGKFS
jgi:hypothetical protein